MIAVNIHTTHSPSSLLSIAACFGVGVLVAVGPTVLFLALRVSSVVMVPSLEGPAFVSVTELDFLTRGWRLPSTKLSVELMNDYTLVYETHLRVINSKKNPLSGK